MSSQRMSTQCYLQLKESIWTGTYKVLFEKECCHLAVSGLVEEDYKHFKYWMKDDYLFPAFDFTNGYEPMECSVCKKPKLELAVEITNTLKNSKPGPVLCWLDENFAFMAKHLMDRHMKDVAEAAIRAKLEALKLEPAKLV